MQKQRSLPVVAAAAEYAVAEPSFFHVLFGFSFRYPYHRFPRFQVPSTNGFISFPIAIPISLSRPCLEGMCCLLFFLAALSLSCTFAIGLIQNPNSSVFVLVCVKGKYL